MVLLKGFFTVPSDVPDGRVLEASKQYIRKYVESYEAEGFKLTSDITFGKSLPLTEDIAEGRARWLMLAYWDREPKRQTVEVDEKHIPKLLETGRFRLAN